jgi:hypothetical protein
MIFLGSCRRIDAGAVTRASRLQTTVNTKNDREQAHQGSVSVDDNPGGGMVFTLRFGRAKSQRNEKSPAGAAGRSK